MISTLFQTARGIALLGASALTLDAILLGAKRITEWETLALEDAEDGDFVTLSDSARMHYVARGNAGSPVILIHGLMSATYEWSKNIDALAQEYRVWAIDLIGFGFSSRVTRPTYSLKYFARSVCEFLDAQEIERASIVGHSLGGAIALQLAHDHPTRVDKLILIDAATYALKWITALKFAARVPYVPRALGSVMTTNPRAHEIALRNALGDPARLDTRTLLARMRASRVRGTVDALLAMTASPHDADVPAGLKKITAPTLVLWGEKDIVLPVQHGERLVRDLPNAQLVILEGAGHIPNEECPSRVNQLIFNFLKKEDANWTPKS